MSGHGSQAREGAGLCHQPYGEERDNTLQRIAENRNIVRWVQGSLHERTASYKVALERMVIAAPSPVAVEAERSLTLLQQRITGYGV